MELIRRLFVDLQGLELDEAESHLLSRPSVAGVVLFTRNYASRGQLSELTAAIKGIDSELVITVDQEGGRVQRFREGFQRLPAARAIGELYERDPGAGLQMAQDIGWLMAGELLDCGVDLSFAPVLDLYSADSGVINDRAFAAEPDSVAALARAFASGLAEFDIAAIGKHFPGHGTVIADSHLELPVDERGEAEIRALDLRPFQQCSDCMAGMMTAHVRYPAVDDMSAGYSKRWIQEILRDDIGFDGLVFSDDLTMQGAAVAGLAPAGTAAHRHTAAAKAERALLAGNDVLLLCNDSDAARAVADWLEGEESRSLTLPGDDGEVLRTRLLGLLPSAQARQAAQLAKQDPARLASTVAKLEALADCD